MESAVVSPRQVITSRDVMTNSPAPFPDLWPHNTRNQREIEAFTGALPAYPAYHRWQRFFGGDASPDNRQGSAPPLGGRKRSIPWLHYWGSAPCPPANPPIYFDILFASRKRIERDVTYYEADWMNVLFDIPNAERAPTYFDDHVDQRQRVQAGSRAARQRRKYLRARKPQRPVPELVCPERRLNESVNPCKKAEDGATT